MHNRQTYTIGDLHLIRVIVAFLYVHPTHVVGEVVIGAGVKEPRLDVAGLVGGRVASMVVLVLERLIEAILALEGLMPPVLANLTSHRLAVVAPATTTALAASAVATTTAPWLERLP
jgi:hypothetical protein